MPKSRKEKDYSKFDSMSTEMLEEILRADFERREKMDMDTILHVMKVIAERKQGRL